MYLTEREAYELDSYNLSVIIRANQIKKEVQKHRKPEKFKEILKAIFMALFINHHGPHFVDDDFPPHRRRS